MANLLKGLRAGERFFKVIFTFSKGLLLVSGITSMIFFWFIVYQFYQPYQAIAVFMLKLVQLGVLCLIVGGIFSCFLYFLHKKLYHDKFKQFEKIRKKKWNSLMILKMLRKTGV